MDDTAKSIINETNGILTINIDDRLLAQKTAGRTKQHAAKQQGFASKQRGGKEQVLVRTPTPETSTKPARPWHGVPLQPNDEMYEQFATGCNLRSKATHKSYMRLLTTARRMCNGIKTAVMVQNPSSCIKSIEGHAIKHGLSPHSVASYLTAILSVIKHTVSCPSKARLKAEIAEWQEAHKKWTLLGAQPYIQNKASAKQAAGWINYTDFCRVRDSLELGTKSRLLLCMYSMIPPCRSDLGACRIFVKPPSAKDLAHFSGNYICLQPPQSKKPSYLHLREFKTARCYAPDGVRTALPDALVQEISHSLQRQPRSWLFAQEHNINKPYSRSAFSTWANRQFQRLTGIRDLNLQIVRHMYVTRAMEVNDTSKLDPCTQAGLIALCEKRLANIAKSMCHSIEQQQRYRFKLKSSGDPETVSKKVVPRQTKASELVVVELLG